MFDVVAPLSAPQVYTPPLRGVLHPLAQHVIDALRRHGPEPTGLWSLLNSLTSARKPQGRDHVRFLSLRFWVALRELLRVKLVFRHGARIALADFPSRPRSTIRPAPSTRTRRRKQTDSNTHRPDSNATVNCGHPVECKQIPGFRIMPTCMSQTESVAPTPADIQAAARTLAGSPRNKKSPWTGYLNGERLKRGWLVRVPTGEVLPAYLVRRSKVLVTLPDTPQHSGRIFERYPASSVTRVKLPAAQLLGRRKAGVKEKPSLRKKESARRNGTRPCRPGKRLGHPVSCSKPVRLADGIH